ncbi:4Fe-4S ferredoxin [Desulfovibrio aminophilus]|uniref:4Fe-4S ferredoxin n=1 Tax=Desulfovibrio aminophilus TaxID=81425 RepID=UPI00339132A5
MTRPPGGSRLRRVHVWIAAGLALTGMAQMPIFKRYYIADLPGLGWLADYYLTNKLHYALAAALLAVMGFAAARWLRDWRFSRRLAPLGLVRVALLAGLALSGGLRVLKNRPELAFDPLTVMLVDWTHLGLAVLLGIVALAAVSTGRSAYAVPRK